MLTDLVVKAEKYRSEYCHTIPWKCGEPFINNPRAVLIHRVRAIGTTVIRGEASHDTAEYWCGNQGRGEFLPDVPDGRLLCARCEALAVAHGQPQADELCGRHVHKGGVRAYQTCCLDHVDKQ